MSAPKPSVSPSAYSMLSQLSQPTKKMAGTFPVTPFGRVMNVRSLSPFASVIHPFVISALARWAWAEAVGC